MIVLIQRVNWARVSIGGATHAEIGKGLLALVGFEREDDEAAIGRMVDRLLSYRVFADADDKMNLDLRTISGELLLVSQFTLAASTGKGLRPGFSGAKAPAEAEDLFANMVEAATQRHPATQSGVFAANMQVSLENDGPVTFILR